MKKMDLFKIGMYVGMGATVGKFFGDIINAALEGFIEGTIEGMTEAKYKHKPPKEVVENLKKSYDEEESTPENDKPIWVNLHDLNSKED